MKEVYKMEFAYTVYKGDHQNYYLYDGTSSNIFEITENLYNNHQRIIAALKDSSITLTTEDDLEDFKQLKEAIEDGTFVKRESAPMSYWFDPKDYIENEIYQKVQLMLGITEICNMRCKYCIYGGHYENERVHSNKIMSIDTMQNAINYFINNSTAPQKAINFYGGEPFTNFKLIKEAVELVKKKEPSIQILITTNGLLLKDEIIDWFFENDNVFLFVSMAGIPEYHDRYRVTIDEKPTYSTIKENLSKMKAINSVAFNQKVNIVFNLFDETQLFDLDDLWKNDSLFSELSNPPEITFIDCFDDDGTIKKMAEDVKKEECTKPNPLNKYIDCLLQKDYDSLFVTYYNEKFLSIHRRSDDTSNKICGVCRPFVKKLFVSVNGDVHMCENFIYSNYFGNVNHDVMVEKVEHLLQEYSNTRDNICQKCWAQKMCSLCFRDIYDRNGEINLTRAHKICETQKNLLLEVLKEYSTILEVDETLLDHLDDYIVSF